MALPSSVTIEVCVDSVQSAVHAVKGGADRLELCANLGIGGGTTPSLGLLKAVQQAVDGLPIMTMVRPRTGDFFYSADEIDVMLRDIRIFKKYGVRGIVVGILTKDGRVDTERMKRIVDEALPLEVCFHRAFDMTRDADEALHDIESIGGISRILTSGQGTSVLEALETIQSLYRTTKRLVEDEPWGLTILPGSGINPSSVGLILDSLLTLGLQEIHLSGASWVEGGMLYRRENMGMGVGGQGEWGVWTTDEQQIREEPLYHRCFLHGCASFLVIKISCSSPHYLLSSPMASSFIPSSAKPPKIWWTNAFFFVSVHLAAAVGVFYRPPLAVARLTLVMAFVLWQFGCLGITIGYHRLYSHRAFHACTGVRIALAAMGSSAFQGSIKWWCLRHRLHHRFTDDPVHDPYAATRGLFYSHVGWIFYKSTYERMELVDRGDLVNDPVVRFQHKHYVSLALFFGFVIPTALARFWDDTLGGFIWGGLLTKLAVWHCTFLVNSLAHWEGLQPYSDENTSRGNLLLALLTSGEGNHNFHAFPHDFRSGPSLTDWDPSKWIILILHRLGFATRLRRARQEDMIEAKRYMHYKTEHGVCPSSPETWSGEVWNFDELDQYVQVSPGKSVILIEGFAVDATSYLTEHPGGAGLLRKYSVVAQPEASHSNRRPDATWAFGGGLNNHSRAARRRMQELRVAKIHERLEAVVTDHK